MPRKFHLTPGAGGSRWRTASPGKSSSTPTGARRRAASANPILGLALPAAFGAPVSPRPRTPRPPCGELSRQGRALSGRRQAAPEPGRAQTPRAPAFAHQQVRGRGGRRPRHHPGHRGWLTSRTGEPTFYDVRVGNGEYAYITGNGLTTRAGQARCVTQKAGLQLPLGDGGTGKSLDTTCAGLPATYGENFGAAEYKAAWLPLRDPAFYPQVPDHRRRRALSRRQGAAAHRRAGPGRTAHHRTRCRRAAVRLGHLEHADNDPGRDPDGRRQALHLLRPAQHAPHPTCCPPRPAPHRNVPAGCVPYNRPVQVVREHLFTQQTIDANASFQALIAANPSVFRNYELVDVQWPNKIGSGAAGRPGAARPRLRRAAQQPAQPRPDRRAGREHHAGDLHPGPLAPVLPHLRVDRDPARAQRGLALGQRGAPDRDRALA